MERRREPGGGGLRGSEDISRSQGKEERGLQSFLGIRLFGSSDHSTFTNTQRTLF